MTETLSVYWDHAIWQRTRSAFIAQLDDPEGARHLVDWVCRAIDAHLERTPAERAELAGDVTRGVGGVRKVHLVDESLLMAVAAAQVADRTAGRYVSRSGWINEAAALAARELEQRFGPLPEPPARLPTGPRPGTSSP